MPDLPKPGQILWQDLTVPDSGSIREFYAKVVGWSSTEHNMGDYSDFNMISSEGKTVAGICHARGDNADVPPAWLIYIIVEDVDASAELCRSSGGKLLAGPRNMGGGRFAVIQDPAGAKCALYAPARQP